MFLSVRSGGEDTDFGLLPGSVVGVKWYRRWFGWDCLTPLVTVVIMTNIGLFNISLKRLYTWVFVSVFLDGFNISVEVLFRDGTCFHLSFYSPLLMWSNVFS